MLYNQIFVFIDIICNMYNRCIFKYIYQICLLYIYVQRI